MTTTEGTVIPGNAGIQRSPKQKVLEVRDLSIVYRSERGRVQAVQQVSFDLHRHEALALIGESGSGKTTVSLSLIRKLPANAEITSGSIRFRPEEAPQDLLGLSTSQLRSFRWQECAMVFQGAQNSFNPVLKIREHFEDTAQAHGWGSRSEVRKRALRLLQLVRLDPERVYDSYPHELSGGMKQRTLLALGVLLQPRIVILDEPTTALDILTQRAMIDVLREMQQQLEFSIIFISHDLSLAAEMADTVATMYAGEIVEIGGVREMFYRARHPYTHGLLRSVPKLDPGKDQLLSIRGAPPNLIHPPPGCRFHPRCDQASERCHREIPRLTEVTPGHQVSCWNPVGAALEEAHE